MSWDSYIQNLTTNQWLDDAVIIGHQPGQESVWAAAPGGWLKRVTPEEVKLLVGTDRDILLAKGVTLAGKKCTVLRDELNLEGQHTMDLKMKTSDKDPDPFPFTIGKSNQALVIGKGVKNAHGGCVNGPIFSMTSYLRKMNL